MAELLQRVEEVARRSRSHARVCWVVMKKWWRVRRDSRKRDQQEQSQGSSGHTGGTDCLRGSGKVPQGRVGGNEEA